MSQYAPTDKIPLDPDVLHQVEEDGTISRIVLYRCDGCGRAVVTQEVDYGYIAPGIPCQVTVGCGTMWREFHTGTPQALQGVIPMFEWYRPTCAEFGTLDPKTQEHVSQGNLLMRKHRLWVQRLIEGIVVEHITGLMAASVKGKKRGLPKARWLNGASYGAWFFMQARGSENALAS